MLFSLGFAVKRIGVEYDFNVHSMCVQCAFNACGFVLWIIYKCTLRHKSSISNDLN